MLFRRLAWATVAVGLMAFGVYRTVESEEKDD